MTQHYVIEDGFMTVPVMGNVVDAGIKDNFGRHSNAFR